MTREEAIQTIEVAIAEVEWNYPMDYAVAFERAIEALREPEIVRCRECNHSEMDDPDFPDQFYCHAGCGWNNEDFYCAYGEKGGDGNG